MGGRAAVGRTPGLHGAVLAPASANSCPGGGISLSPARDTATSIVEDTSKRFAELTVEDAVNDRVHSHTAVQTPLLLYLWCVCRTPRCTACCTTDSQEIETNGGSTIVYPVYNLVYDWVHGTVDVTEPGEDSEDQRRHAAGTTQSADQVHREERTPRHKKDAHDDAECDGGFVVGHLVAQWTAGRSVFLLVHSDADNLPLRMSTSAKGGLVCHPDRLYLFARVAVQSVIDTEHCQTGQVEADCRRCDRVYWVQLQHTDAVLAFRPD